MSDEETPQQPLLLLRRIWIRGFRSLGDVGPLPIQPGLTVLTGVNDGGKSATLDAIAFLLTGRGADRGDINRWKNDDGLLEVEGEFEEINGGGSVRLRARLAESGGVDVEVQEMLHPLLGARPADMTLPELREAVETCGIDSPGGTAKAPYLEAVEGWLAEQSEDELEPQWRRAQREDQAAIPGYSRFDSGEAPSPVAHVQGVLSREARRLLQSEQFADELQTVVERLEGMVAPSVEAIKLKILEYCPDLEDIEVEPHFDFARPSLDVDISVNRAGKAVDLERSGHGRRRRIELAIHEANLESLESEQPQSTELLAYDEPDTHLDYASQRSLFEILDRQARLGHVQAIVVTHSLNFIDKVPLQSILHYELGDDLSTEVEMLVTDGHDDEVEFLGSICAGLGLRNSVLLDERRFLVVEGETEEAAVPTIFKKVTGRTLTTAGITVVNTKGSGAIRRLVEVVGTEWQREVVVLADSDARDALNAWTGRLGVDEAGGTLHFIGTEEFEDAFSDEAWLHALERYEPADDDRPWLLEEIAEVRGTDDQKFSESLCNLVRRRCRDTSIGKPDLGLALAESIAPDEIPAALRHCLESVTPDG